MPFYDYQCLDCRSRDRRLAGLDDHLAVCAACGGPMVRLDADIFQAYFEETPGLTSLAAEAGP